MNKVHENSNLSDNFLKALDVRIELFLKNVEIQALNIELSSEKFLHIYYKNLWQSLIRGEDLC